LAIPERFGVLSSWFVGLLVDILTGRLLGQNALVYGVLSYIVIKFHKRLRQYPLIQQAFVICMMLISAQIMLFWVESLRKEEVASGWAFSLPIVTGTFAWPVVFVLLRKLRLWSQIR
jgi:rod shape-determining protein MreD